MKKIALLSLFAAAAFAETWTGYLSDAGCGAKHADGSEKSAACAKACVTQKGMAAVLVVGDKVVTIAEASKAKVVEHLGHKVTVTGKIENEKIVIDSVEMAH
jgi:hypothetical protein